MRSRVAEELRAELREEVLRMTLQERLDLSVRLGEEDLANFMSASGISRDEALARIRKQRQRGRRQSRCMSE